MGIQDSSVWMAYLLCISSTILCVVEHILNGNKEGSEEPPEEVKPWAQEENHVEEEL